MIIPYKTKAQRAQERATDQAKSILKKLFGYEKFILLGQLADGRWAFCHTVWAYHDGVAQNGKYKLLFNPVRYYEHASHNHVQIEQIEDQPW